MMMKTNKHNGSAIVEVAIFAFVICVIAVIFAVIVYVTGDNLSYWISYIKGVPVEVPVWVSILVSIIFNGVIIVANILSELIRLFM